VAAKFSRQSSQINAQRIAYLQAFKQADFIGEGYSVLANKVCAFSLFALIFAAAAAAAAAADWRTTSG
jgi:ABC-type transporter Mla maintaining outer membrane lipid asymmetry permease subunit MlaE